MGEQQSVHEQQQYPGWPEALDERVAAWAAEQNRGAPDWGSLTPEGRAHWRRAWLESFQPAEAAKFDPDPFPGHRHVGVVRDAYWPRDTDGRGTE